MSMKYAYGEMSVPKINVYLPSQCGGSSFQKPTAGAFSLRSHFSDLEPIRSKPCSQEKLQDCPYVSLSGHVIFIIYCHLIGGQLVSEQRVVTMEDNLGYLQD